MHMKLVAVVRACLVLIPKRANRFSRAEEKENIQLDGKELEKHLLGSSKWLASTGDTGVSTFATA